MDSIINSGNSEDKQSRYEWRFALSQHTGIRRLKTVAIWIGALAAFLALRASEPSYGGFELGDWIKSGFIGLMVYGALHLGIWVVDGFVGRSAPKHRSKSD
jgi:hypothetical protein